MQGHRDLALGAELLIDELAGCPGDLDPPGGRGRPGASLGARLRRGQRLHRPLGFQDTHATAQHLAKAMP